ncbi:hypothetical protein [Bacillus mycoides]|uniref:hypothetical protein n=1 Tax=Bacillus mycoides TaxID=1405 RepID=UPI001C02C9E4|nr:hypothetical protein [Bacillus mycoides]QWG36680.1 hypothetical protein EXW30_28130 [Bacillus mycoides]
MKRIKGSDFIEQVRKIADRTDDFFKEGVLQKIEGMEYRQKVASSRNTTLLGKLKQITTQKVYGFDEGATDSDSKIAYDHTLYVIRKLLHLSKEEGSIFEKDLHGFHVKLHIVGDIGFTLSVHNGSRLVLHCHVGNEVFRRHKILYVERVEFMKTLNFGMLHQNEVSNTVFNVGYHVNSLSKYKILEKLQNRFKEEGLLSDTYYGESWKIYLEENEISIQTFYRAVTKAEFQHALDVMNMVLYMEGYGSNLQL